MLSLSPLSLLCFAARIFFFFTMPRRRRPRDGFSLTPARAIDIDFHIGRRWLTPRKQRHFPSILRFRRCIQVLPRAEPASRFHDIHFGQPPWPLLFSVKQPACRLGTPTPSPLSIDDDAAAPRRCFISASCQALLLSAFDAPHSTQGRRCRRRRRKLERLAATTPASLLHATISLTYSRHRAIKARHAPADAAAHMMLSAA